MLGTQTVRAGARMHNRAEATAELPPGDLHIANWENTLSQDRPIESSQTRWDRTLFSFQRPSETAGSLFRAPTAFDDARGSEYQRALELRRER